MMAIAVVIVWAMVLRIDPGGAVIGVAVAGLVGLFEPDLRRRMRA